MNPYYPHYVYPPYSNNTVYSQPMNPSYSTPYSQYSNYSSAYQNGAYPPYYSSSVPHTNPNLQVPDTSQLENQFFQYSEYTSHLLNSNNKVVNSLSNEDKLNLYGYYKQAVNGDNSHPKPSFFQFKDKMKHKAWEENKGMSKWEAMSKYIQLVEEIKTKLQL